MLENSVGMLSCSPRQELRVSRVGVVDVGEDRKARRYQDHEFESSVGVYLNICQVWVCDRDWMAY